jgi:hypothetical protein
MYLLFNPVLEDGELLLPEARNVPCISVNDRRIQDDKGGIHSYDIVVVLSYCRSWN